MTQQNFISCLPIPEERTEKTSYRPDAFVLYARIMIDEYS